MSVGLRTACATICLLLAAATASAQTESVGTSASETAAYGTASQGFGPFPWSDLGITASASVTPGTLSVQTGGSTSFDLPAGTVTPGEFFNPGSTTLNLGYTPGFAGSSISGAPAASGNLNSSFVYNLGPLGSGTVPIVNATVPVVGLGTANLNSGLNSGIGIASLSQSTSTAPAGLTLTAQAQVCFIVCATVASASISFDVQGQTSQNVLATPTATYGDLVWESTTQTYSPTDSFTFVAGAGGDIANVFKAPTGLSLTSGETFYYNFLPVVQVNMPVVNTAEVAVPASITASYDILGAGGSETFPLGDLYSLATGGGFDFNPEFFGSEFYSIPLVYTACQPNTIACFPSYEVPGGGGSTTTNGGGTVPGDMGPNGCLVIIDCVNNVPLNPPTTGGGGNGGPLGPGPMFNNPDPCEPAGVALLPGYTCNTTLTQTPGMPTAEPNSGGLLTIGVLALGIVWRRRLFA